MLIDVDYSHYWIGEPTDDAQFGPSGTVAVNAGSVLVSTFTQGGPVSVRILVGDLAPGAAEDAWRSEWEYVQEVLVENATHLEVRTWEYAEADPPSGPFVGPGRWALRFHSRGQAKVDAEDRMPETAFEEHLVLVWPAAAQPGGSPVWEEVTGIAARPEWSIADIGRGGPVNLPGGSYRLTGGSAPTDPTTPESEAAGLVQVADDDLVVISGTNEPFDVFAEGHEFSQDGDAMTTGSWRVAALGHLKCSRPIRFLDATGQTPRSIPDPLLPAGSWQVRILVLPEEGHPLTEFRYDQRLQIWPMGAPTREQAEDRPSPLLDVTYSDATTEGDWNIHVVGEKTQFD